MPLAAHAPPHDPVQRAKHPVQQREDGRREAQPAVREIRHRRLRQTGNVANLLEWHRRQMQDTGAADLFEAVDFRDVRARGRGDPRFASVIISSRSPKVIASVGHTCAQAGSSPTA